MDKRQKLKIFLVAALSVMGTKAQADNEGVNTSDDILPRQEIVKDESIINTKQMILKRIKHTFDSYNHLINDSNLIIPQQKADTLAKKVDVTQVWQEVCAENGSYTKPNSEEKIYLNKIAGLDSTIASYCSALKNYTFDAEDLILMKPDTVAKQMAEMSPQAFTGLKNPKNCYHAIKYLLMKLLPIAYMEGRSAWQAQEWLEDNPNFVSGEVDFPDLDKVVPSILVFKNTKIKPNGHISTSVPNNKGQVQNYTNASGNILQYNTSRDYSDVARNAFINAGNKYKYVTANFLAKTQLDIKTIIKIGYQKAKEITSHMYISPQDVYGVLSDIVSNSREMMAEKVVRAQLKQQGFLNEKGKHGYYKYAEQKISKMPNIKRSSPRGRGINIRSRTGYPRT